MGSDSDPTTYLNELLRTNKPELKNETLPFPTPEFFCKTEDQTPIQTRFYNEIYELKSKKKKNTENDFELGSKLIQNFDRTGKLF